VTSEVIEVKDRPDVSGQAGTALARLGSAARRDLSRRWRTAKPVFCTLEAASFDALEPGFYGFWICGGGSASGSRGVRLQTLEIPGRDLDQDKVSIRVNVWAEYRVTDAVKAKQSVKDYAEYYIGRYSLLSVRLGPPYA